MLGICGIHIPQNLFVCQDHEPPGLKVGKSDLRGGINRDAVASFSPTLPLRLRWERNEIGSVNRNAVAPVLNAVCFVFDATELAQPIQGWENRRLRSQGSRNGNLGLEDGTALRL